MITTREINVNLTKGKLKLRHVTTKDIDAGVRVEPPKESIKPRGVSTTTLPDVADMAEKKRRDDIMAEAMATKSVKIAKIVKPNKEATEAMEKLGIKDEKKLAMKDEKKIVTAEKKEAKKEKIIEPIETITHPVAKDIKVGKTISGEQGIEMGIEENKPWGEMTEEERQDELKETMAVKEGPKLVEPSKELTAELKAEEKKFAMKERMAKVREAKKAKKKK